METREIIKDYKKKIRDIQKRMKHGKDNQNIREIIDENNQLYFKINQMCKKINNTKDKETTLQSCSDLKISESNARKVCWAIPASKAKAGSQLNSCMEVAKVMQHCWPFWPV